MSHYTADFVRTFGKSANHAITYGTDLTESNIYTVKTTEGNLNSVLVDPSNGYAPIGNASNPLMVSVSGEGLDVSVQGVVQVSATALDIRHLNAVNDNLSVVGLVDVSVQGTVPVSATALDIRALSSGTDSVAITTAGALDVSVQGTVPVSATALDIRALSSGTDSVAITTTGALDVSVQGTVPISSGSVLDVSVQHPVPVQGLVGVGSGLSSYQDLRLSSEGAVINAPRCLSQSLVDGVNNTQELPRSCTGNFIATPVFPVVYNGSTWDRLRGNTGGIYTIEAPAQVSVSTAKSSSVTETGENLVSAACYIHGWQLINTANNKAIVGIYDSSGNPSATDTNLVVYARSGDTITEMLPPGREIYHANGIGTRGQTSSGALDLTNTSAVSANSICLKVFYSLA